MSYYASNYSAGPRPAVLEAVMSLLKHPALTPQKLEANQANARLSKGPATTEGIERVHEAHLLHGFYSKDSGEAIRARREARRFRALGRLSHRNLGGRERLGKGSPIENDGKSHDVVDNKGPGSNIER